MISELNRLKQHMHYVDFDTKTKQTIIRFAIYIVLGLVAIAVSLLVVMAARGYDVDPATGKVVRNGLVLLWSQPEAVDVYINGNLEDNTPARFPLPVGTYDIKMSKAGYRDWTKTTQVRPSEVVKLNYPRLFPNDIKAESATTLASAVDWLQSPDQETLATQTKADSREVLLYNIEDITASPDLITIPESVITRTPGVADVFKLSQWSADSDYLMIEHLSGTKSEFIRANVIDKEFINVNKTLSLDLSNVQFDRSENDKMYGLTNGQLRRINVKDKVATAALVAEIVDYRVSADGRVLAIQKRPTTSSLVMLGDDDQVSTITSSKTTDTNLLELGNFEGDDYAVVSLNPNETKLIWLDDKEGRKSNLIATIPGKNNQVYPASFTGRFAVVSSGDIVTVHDFEKMRVFEFKFAGMTSDSLSWFDDGHLITTTKSGDIDVIEFDGQNMTNIGKGSNFKVYTDKDFSSFYSLAKQADGRTSLNVSNLRP